MKENNEWKIGAMTLVIAFLVVMAGVGWAKYVDEKREADRLTERYAEAQEEITYLDWNLNSVVFERDNLKADLEKQPECRPNRCDGDLIACLHNEKYYKNALDNISPYCSEGMYELQIEGLKNELKFCRNSLAVIAGGDLRGAPCHSHYEGEFTGVHCGWETYPMLYECAFGELGWVGSDRLMCDINGNPHYHDAQAICFSDRNCSSCLEMTDGNLEHCFAFAYYP